MIVKELFKTRKDGVNLYRTYSDEGKSIIQKETGIVYEEAIDVEDAPYTYEEVIYGGYREILDTIDESFNKGERGWWKGELYECLYDNNPWNPEQFAAGWIKITT